jgi:D-glycero-D-manno-heptose 1,7-bisphosphate phosphatase
MMNEPQGVKQVSAQSGNRSAEFRPGLRAVFLGRNGVINRQMPEGHYVTAWQYFELLPGVPGAIARLNLAGLRVLIVSNQRGIALGLYTAADVDAIHTQMQRVLSVFGAHIDGIYFCPHDKGECNCRKPLPGLFEQAQAQFPNLQPADSLMIGDSLSDIEFGRNLGLQTVLITGSQEHQKPEAIRAAGLADLRFSSLTESVDYLLA